MRSLYVEKRARRVLRQSGRSEVTMPDKFDGATLVVSIQQRAPAVRQQGHRAGPHCRQSSELVINVQATSAWTSMRDFLLGLPGCPRKRPINCAHPQLNQTLPVPIPTDKVN